MLKTYDTTLQAYTERLPKHYDSSQSAWVESNSAKTYDTTLNAWVERLYADYFTLKFAPQLDAEDGFTISTNEINLFTSQTSMQRRIYFELPFAWNGETVEFDLVSNGVAYVYFGKGCRNEWGDTISGYDMMITESYNGKVTIPLGTLPDEIKGYPVASSEIYLDIGTGTVSEEMGYVNIRNLKIGGKKYGFKE